MNHLWILRPNRDAENDLWQPWYDKSFGFVVRAETEEDARAIASESAGDEGADAWLKPEYSSCDSLENDGDSGLVMQDFHSA